MRTRGGEVSAERLELARGRGINPHLLIILERIEQKPLAIESITADI